MLADSRQRAFSVPELLAVVAIVVIVLALLLPSLGKSRQAAHQAMCASNLHQLHIAYANRKVDVKAGGTEPINPYSWPSSLAGYVTSNRIYICPEQLHGEGQVNSSTDTLYLKVFNAYPNGYLYDMTLVAGPLCRQVDKNMTDAQIDALWANAPAAGNLIKGYRNGLPSSGNAYLLCFEDLRPTGGDKDYEDVIIQVEELDGEVRLKYVYDGAGYKFDLMQGDKLIWAQMDNGGTTKPGSVTNVPISPASYGMNVEARSMTSGGQNVILMLDYIRSAAKGTGTTGWDPWNDWLLPNGRYRFARHYNQANVLFTDGSIRLMHADTMNPAISANRLEYWDPKN